MSPLRLTGCKTTVSNFASKIIPAASLHKKYTSAFNSSDNVTDGLKQNLSRISSTSMSQNHGRLMYFNETGDAVKT